MSEDNRPNSGRPENGAETFSMADGMSTRAARAVNKKLAELEEGPIKNATETRIAIANWKVQDSLVGLSLLTSFIAIAAFSVALTSTNTVPGWVAFSVAVVGGIGGYGVLNDKHYWEVAKAILEHRLAETGRSDTECPRTHEQHSVSADSPRHADEDDANDGPRQGSR